MQKTLTYFTFHKKGNKPTMPLFLLKKNSLPGNLWLFLQKQTLAQLE